MNTLDYIKRSVRTASILTGAFVANTIVDANSVAQDNSIYNQLVLLLDFTLGSLTTMDIKLEFSPDGTNWYQEVSSSIAAGVDTVSPLVHRFAATGKFRFPVPIKDRFIRISALGNGTATSSSLTIDAVLGTSAN